VATALPICVSQTPKEPSLEKVAVESSLLVRFLIKNRRLGETNEERDLSMTRGVQPEQEAALGNLRKLGSDSGILSCILFGR
jgi:hypothetical protein